MMSTSSFRPATPSWPDPQSLPSLVTPNVSRPEHDETTVCNMSHLTSMDDGVRQRVLQSGIPSPIRFKGQGYFGFSVQFSHVTSDKIVPAVQGAETSSGADQVRLCPVVQEMSPRRKHTRKITRNPLRTKLTVRQLKELLPTLNQPMNDEAESSQQSNRKVINIGRDSVQRIGEKVFVQQNIKPRKKQKQRKKTKAKLSVDDGHSYSKEYNEDAANRMAADAANRSAADTTNRSATDAANRMAADLANGNSADAANRSAADLANGNAADAANRFAADLANRNAADAANRCAADAANRSAADAANRSAADAANRNAGGPVLRNRPIKPLVNIEGLEDEEEYEDLNIVSDNDNDTNWEAAIEVSSARPNGQARMKKLRQQKNLGVIRNIISLRKQSVTPTAGVEANKRIESQTPETPGPSLQRPEHMDTSRPHSVSYQFSAIGRVTASKRTYRMDALKIGTCELRLNLNHISSLNVHYIQRYFMYDFDYRIPILTDEGDELQLRVQPIIVFSFDAVDMMAFDVTDPELSIVYFKLNQPCKYCCGIVDATLSNDEGNGDLDITNGQVQLGHVVHRLHIRESKELRYLHSSLVESYPRYFSNRICSPEKFKQMYLQDCCQRDRDRQIQPPALIEMKSCTANREEEIYIE